MRRCPPRFALHPNTPPIAADDPVLTPFETAVTLDVLANDSDPEGDPITVVAVGTATNGAVVDNGSAPTVTDFSRLRRRRDGRHRRLLVCFCRTAPADRTTTELPTAGVDVGLHEAEVTCAVSGEVLTSTTFN